MADLARHPNHDDEARIALAIALAGELLEAPRPPGITGRAIRYRDRRTAAIIESAEAADFTVALTDEVARLADPRKGAARLAQLVRGGVPKAFPPLDRVMLALGGRFAPLLPRLVMPMVTRKLRSASADLIVDADERALAAHLGTRAAARPATRAPRANVNVLGEAILGDGEARRRLDAVLACIARPDVDHVSVKISSICAGVNVLAFERTVERVAVALRGLYRASMAARPFTFVNLDMEEYRDLQLTIAAFTTVLDEPEFRSLDAGIVLQAYLPDSHEAATRLCEWAAIRHEAGGGRIKIRVVKGANLAMELVEAELRGWPAATYPTKADVDASYKRVVDTILQARFDRAVHLGLASHNVFDIAWAMVLVDEMRAAGRPDRVEFEMLEGMAPAQAMAVLARQGNVLLYTPVVGADDFVAAIAYLVRRLDENTSPDNFLAHVLSMRPGSPAFHAEAAKFAASVRARNTVSTVSRRAIGPEPPPTSEFHNQPDSDVTQPAVRAALAAALAAPWSPTVVEPVSLADVDRAVITGTNAAAAWSAKPAGERAAVLRAIADVVQAHRFEIVACMAHEAGKTVAEGDPEVSEAIDFCRYYAATCIDHEVHRSALGVVVVAPPWNFPYAIALGGVVAALAAGNSVILKPAPQTRPTAWLAAQHCWEAGVPADVLQFVPTDDDDAGRHLITHTAVSAVVLTGALATAQMFLQWRPSMRLHAETSGKNAMIITAAADIDLAVRDAVRSAFGHAGQKCSATSRLIVEASLLDSSTFLDRLADAAATLRVGPAADPSTDVGPLIEPASGALLRALTTLDPGERWLLQPRPLDADRRLWTPGIRLGVRAGSWLERTECFGPVLAVIRAGSLDEAIDIQNDCAYGLTAGIHSLDGDEVATWTSRVQAGNLYVNRGTTGAIVRRQPFGGWKASAVGPTSKAGGPHYVASLQRWRDDPAVEVGTAAAGFRQWAADWIDHDHDWSSLRAESNRYRCCPLPRGVVLRVGAGVTDAQRERSVRLAQAAAAAAGVRLEVSPAAVGDDEFARLLSTLDVDRLRVVGSVPDSVLAAAHAAHVAVDDQPPVACAEGEMWRWCREQTVSSTEHRHGRLPHVPPGPRSTWPLLDHETLEGRGSEV
jgi:RHH-type proline utilization regulon transcriptional repressor/proline dehydrogenase/delta 1-pyrroline-5-carboxylate dehydrogenase